MRRSIADILCDAVQKRSRDRNVALLLSGGVDSQSVGFCLNRLGKRVAAYSFELEDYRSRDCERAQDVAEALGWKFHRITIPTDALADDFIRLAVEFNCRKKKHFEMG